MCFQKYGGLIIYKLIDWFHLQISVLKLLYRKDLHKFYSNEMLRMKAKEEIAGDRTLSAHPIWSKIASLVAEKGKGESGGPSICFPRDSNGSRVLKVCEMGMLLSVRQFVS